MTRDEFIEKAKAFGYIEDEIREVLNGVDDIMKTAPDCFEFDYDVLLLFEQPIGDI